jgi:hypothetical protein
MKRCVKCIMPETAKGIQLNEEGLCQLCISHKDFTPKGENALRKEIAENLKANTNQQNNCVVPISGGRDSTYVLYYAKKVLGLNPVALHNDNDFETPIATQNLEVTASTLDVPLVRVRSMSGIGKKIVAEKFKMNAPFGCGLIASQTCEACKYGFESASYNYARNHGISLILWGDSKFESTAAYYDLNKEQCQTPNKWQRLLSAGAIPLLKYKYYFHQLKKEYGPDTPHGLHEIHLYDYAKWDENVIVDTIRSIGWREPENAVTSWRIDCYLVPLVDYLVKKTYGVSKIELGFSVMVRNGKMNRDEAIRKAEMINQNRDLDQIRQILADMSIPAKLIREMVT